MVTISMRERVFDQTAVVNAKRSQKFSWDNPWLLIDGEQQRLIELVGDSDWFLDFTKTRSTGGLHWMNLSSKHILLIIIFLRLLPAVHSANTLLHYLIRRPSLLDCSWVLRLGQSHAISPRNSYLECLCFSVATTNKLSWLNHVAFTQPFSLNSQKH